jgi:hypothetical protein
MEAAPWAAPSTPRHALREPGWVRPPRHRVTRSVNLVGYGLLDTAARAPWNPRWAPYAVLHISTQRPSAPHLDATAHCPTPRRKDPLLHIPGQQPPAPHFGATAPCSTSRSNSPLLRISEQEHSAPHFGARHRAPDHASERAQRAPIARDGPSAKSESGRETPARPNGSRPHAKRPHDQTARGHTRHAPDSKRPAASGPAPNGTAAARPPTDRPPVRQATPKRASSRRAVRAASAAGSASDRRRVSQ